MAVNQKALIGSPARTAIRDRLPLMYSHGLIQPASMAADLQPEDLRGAHGKR